MIKQEVGYSFQSTEIPEEQINFCCEPMRQHIEHHTFYYNNKDECLEIESYDHDVIIMKYCFNCGQKIEIEYLGKQMMKRDEQGVLNVKVGDLQK